MLFLWAYENRTYAFWVFDDIDIPVKRFYLFFFLHIFCFFFHFYVLSPLKCIFSSVQTINWICLILKFYQCFSWKLTFSTEMFRFQTNWHLALFILMGLLGILAKMAHFNTIFIDVAKAIDIVAHNHHSILKMANIRYIKIEASRDFSICKCFWRWKKKKTFKSNSTLCFALKFRSCII